ncbi:glycosyltransferase family 4 protein [Acidobacteriota bacterium]
MKIGISLLCARKNRTGLENVAFNLIKQLSQIDNDNKYVIYTNKQIREWVSPKDSSIQVVDVTLSCRRYLWVWEHLYFLTHRKNEEIDLLHFPISGGVVGYKGKFILTVHDLKHYRMKNLVKLRRHVLNRFWYNANIKRAKMIITVSEYVKNDVLKNFNIPEENIRVIYNGVDDRFRPCEGSSGFRSKYKLPSDYILFVGQTTPSKNIRRAIDAVKLVREKYNFDCPFVVAGPQGEEDELLKKYVKNNNLENIVQFCGYIADDDMPKLYSNSKLFLSPSITEGFGLPMLEAVSCGIPVVAANTASMPEILGDAAIWVDPFSVDSIAEGIRKALVDKDDTSKMIKRGLLRVKDFSWEKMTRETLRVYSELGRNQYS